MQPTSARQGSRRPTGSNLNEPPATGTLPPTSWRHEDGDNVARRVFETVARYGDIASTAVLERPNGERVPIDFHMRRLAAGTEYLTVMRRAVG